MSKKPNSYKKYLQKRKSIKGAGGGGGGSAKAGGTARLKPPDQNTNAF